MRLSHFCILVVCVCMVFTSTTATAQPLSQVQERNHGNYLPLMTMPPQTPTDDVSDDLRVSREQQRIAQERLADYLETHEQFWLDNNGQPYEKDTYRDIIRINGDVMDIAEADRAFTNLRTQVPYIWERQKNENGSTSTQPQWKPFKYAATHYLYLQETFPELADEHRPAVYDLFFKTERLSDTPASARPSVRIVSCAREKDSGGGTYNQRVVWAVYGYLLAVDFEAHLTGEQRQRAANEKTVARAFLDCFLEDYLREMTFESDSSYELEYLQSMLILYRFVQDSALRSNVEVVLDKMSRSYASKYLDGHYASPNTRAKYNMSQFSTRGSRSPSAELLHYALFGSTRLEPREAHASWLYIVDEIGYTPPQDALDMAHHPGVVEGSEYFSVYPYFRWQPQEFLDVDINRTTYKNGLVSLSSLWYEPNQRGMARKTFRHHQINWQMGINIDGVEQNIFVTNPRADTEQLEGRANLFSSQYEWSTQHRNVLATTFRIPEEADEEKMIRGPLPHRDFPQTHTTDNWFFGQNEDTYLAMYFSRPYELKEGGVQHYSNDYDSVESRGWKHAVIVAVYRQSQLPTGVADIQSFGDFMEEHTTIEYREQDMFLRVRIPVTDPNDRNNLISEEITSKFHQFREINRKPLRIRTESRYNVY